MQEKLHAPALAPPAHARAGACFSQIGNSGRRRSKKERSKKGRSKKERRKKERLVEGKQV
jgi:hypothetical protein